MDESTLGKRIRQRREEKGLTMSELCRLTGVQKGNLSKIESGGSLYPSVHTVLTLAQALGTTVEDLMGVPLQSGDIPIPPALQEFIQRGRLPYVDMTMLAAICYRGKRPKTVRDWWFLYEAIKRSVGETSRE